MKVFMKNFKSVILFIIILCLILVPFAGCDNNSPDTETDLEIYFWRAGLGEDFIEKIIKEFEHAYPQYNVIYNRTTWSGTISNSFGLENSDTVDLWMFDQAPIVSKLSEYGEQLDDILETTFNGESMAIGDKIYTDIKNQFLSPDGHYYSLPYGGGYISLVYDANIIDGSTLKVPNTTVELDALVGQLSDANYVPFMNFSGGGYWQYVYNVWQAQYDGLDYYNNNFLTLTDENGLFPSKEILKREDGRRKVLSVLESIIKPNTVATGSNAFSFTEAQTKFLNGYAVMMANGGWLMNEMKTSVSGNENIAMMKVPVISLITDQCSSIEDDEELSALINAIDNYSSANQVPLIGDGYNVTRADADKIYYARNYISTSYTSSAFIIPKYANAKTAAKDFIKFYFSDDSMETYFQETRILPVCKLSNGSFDTSTMTQWELNLMNFGSSAIALSNDTSNKSKIFTMTPCTPYASLDIISTLSNTNINDRKDAASIWTNMMAVFDNNWLTYLTDAGFA